MMEDDGEYENSDEEEVQIINNEDIDLGKVDSLASRVYCISNTQLF